MLAFETLERLGLSAREIRQYGRQLHRDEADWDGRTDQIEIPEPVALSLLLVNYLTRLTPLSDRDALSIVDFFGNEIHAQASAFLRAHTMDPLNEIGVICLEILDGKYARMGSLEDVFDIDEQRKRPTKEIVGAGSAIWSFSIALPGLMAVIVGSNDLCKQQENPEGQAV